VITTEEGNYVVGESTSTLSESSEYSVPPR
jgi:hypothetical protein